LKSLIEQDGGTMPRLERPEPALLPWRSSGWMIAPKRQA
jgi:hypothetical protein